MARTLEYAFDDYALARFAEAIGAHKEAGYFANRSLNYRNVIDSGTLLARGRLADGGWLYAFRSVGFFSS